MATDQMQILPTKPCGVTPMTPTCCEVYSQLISWPNVFTLKLTTTVFGACHD
jgi:hypothetical protein